MKIVYSFNKSGYEAEQWTREIAAASDESVTFIPFNHGAFADPNTYLDSVQLDQRYQRRDPALLKLQAALLEVLRKNDADVLFVTNAPPYHPDFLRTVPAYKVLYSTDDPGATYMRTIPYVHGYDHVMHCAPTYSADMDLGEKLRYAGARHADWLPLGVFDFEFDTALDEAAIQQEERDIDVVYVGSFFRQKMEFLARIKKKLGKRLQMHGFFYAKHNLWWNVKFGAPGWIRPIGFQERVRLYRRSKVGFNVHWNEFGLGNQRLYHLSANAVAQICDCADHVSHIYQPGKEIDTYRSADELLQKIDHYLQNDTERRKLATAAYRRTMAEYRIETVTRHAARLIARARNASGS
jgi:spore maturation protein CgeB